MHYRIRHTTLHHFQPPVFLEPHLFRLRPRADGTQHLARYELRIDPQPEGRSETLDAEGNALTQAWFTGLTEKLAITTCCEVETYRANPFDFFLEPSASLLPFDYKEDLKAKVLPYLASGPADEGVRELARSAANDADYQTVPFLMALVNSIHGRYRQSIREEGNPWTPTETLARTEASCRDLSVLAMAACQAMGLAARFVSGYQEGDPNQTKRYLHAWVEVFLPGGGWRAYDPTLGLAVADRHIPLAASRQSFGAAPIEGTYRGDGQSDLQVDIELEALPSGED